MATKVWLHPLESEQRRKRQSILARKLLRAICNLEGIGLSENELRLPGLELIELFSSRDNIGLSIAHCPGMLAIALGPDRVGVDCEVMGRRRNWQGIANVFFTPGEAQAVSAARPEDREAVFLRHWVLKEAHIKAIRGSIFGDLNRLVVDSELGPVVDNPDSTDIWRFRETEQSRSLIAACSSHGEEIVFLTVDLL
jgi:phosphopantetheinyl transferase